MQLMNNDLHLSRQRFNAVLWLVVASLMCVGILAARALWTERLGYRFMVWNLFLAWIPLVCALAAERLRGAGAVIAGVVWLAFFPNAPYIITDLVHLRGQGSWLFWVDMIMLLSFAMTGLLLGYLSLYVMQKKVAGRFGRSAGWAFALGTLALSGFGIYIGRFERFNSWDVVFNPIELAQQIWQIFRHPFDHLPAYAVSALFAVFLVGMYLALYHFTRQSHAEPALQRINS